MWSASPDEIKAAVARIDPSFLKTPLLQSRVIDRHFGAEVVFKDETANPIRSFKGRGACNLLSQMIEVKAVVTASAGNFGQGMAWAARLTNMSLTVFASTNAVSSKVEAMRALGAKVVLEGEDFDAAKDAAAAYAEANKLPFIEDGAHAEIAEGAGTIALEITEELISFDLLLAPLGNGALAAGLGAWVKHALPAAETIAVASAGAPAMAWSVKKATVVSTKGVNTIADGIAVRAPILSAVHAVRRVVGDVLLVEDDHIRSAMIMVKDSFGLTVEPAGVAGLAAMVACPERWRGKRIVMPLCGGNV